MAGRVQAASARSSMAVRNIRVILFMVYHSICLSYYGREATGIVCYGLPGPMAGSWVNRPLLLWPERSENRYILSSMGGRAYN